MNQMADANIYKAQMCRSKEGVQQKRPNREGQVILLHHNARPHSASIVKATLQELEWEVLLHPPYYPDLAPSDYHLFRSLSNGMRNFIFANEEKMKKWLGNFPETREEGFYKRGIEKLVERWEKVAYNMVEYTID